MFVRSVVAVGLLVTANGGAAAVADSDERPAKITATALAYLVPEHEDFVMVIAPVDVRRLHVEGRYNYEALRSGSVFAGVNASWGDRLKLKLTPMIGGVFGELDGLVPALRLSLAWWKLDLYSESEVVVDLDDPGASFFYDWSELGFSPLAWLRFGAVIQRSRVFLMPRDFQRGLFVAATIRFVTLSVYEFNLGWTTPTWVFALGVSF
jgi:hypothetical protein